MNPTDDDPTFFILCRDVKSGPAAAAAAHACRASSRTWACHSGCSARSIRHQAAVTAVVSYPAK
jgi:hypothetical protein